MRSLYIIMGITLATCIGVKAICCVSQAIEKRVNIIQEFERGKAEAKPWDGN